MVLLPHSCTSPRHFLTPCHKCATLGMHPQYLYLIEYHASVHPYGSTPQNQRQPLQLLISSWQSMLASRLLHLHFCSKRTLCQQAQTVLSAAALRVNTDSAHTLAFETPSSVVLKKARLHMWITFQKVISTFACTQPMPLPFLPGNTCMLCKPAYKRTLNKAALSLLCLVMHAPILPSFWSWVDLLVCLKPTSTFVPREQLLINGAFVFGMLATQNVGPS